jgi:hypothetical protein
MRCGVEKDQAAVSLKTCVVRPNTKSTDGGALSPDSIGGDEGDRTPDLMNAIHALSQLSYIPKKLVHGSGFKVWSLDFETTKFRF